MIGSMFREVDKLKLGMDASWKRSEVIINNIANNDTPGYKRASVAFEDYYKAALSEEPGFAMKRTRDKHLSGQGAMSDPAFQVVTDTATSMRMDGNNVDMEKEMSDLSTNTLYYYTLQSKVASELNQLRTAITGGR